MRQKTANPTPVKSVEETPKETCHHYWVIASPQGASSKGVCKFCGIEREFFNSWPFNPVGKTTEGPPAKSNPISPKDMDEVEGEVAG